MNRAISISRSASGRNVVPVSSWLVLAALVSGCSGAEDAQNEHDELTSIESALGPESCAPPTSMDASIRADGNRVISRGVNGIIGDIARSPTTYDNRTRYRARKVRIDGPVGPRPDRPVPIGSPGPTFVYVGPVSLLTKEADCLATSVRAILFGHGNIDLSNPPTFVGPEYGYALVERRASASWSRFLEPGFACSIPWVQLGHPEGGQPGLPYHVAVTARTNGVTRAVDVVTTKNRLAPPGVNICQALDSCVRPP